MQFSRKKLESLRAMVLSQKPMFAGVLEERMARLMPAIEVSLDSFEDYFSAYEHASNIKTLSLIVLHVLEKDTLPINAVDELSHPYEASGAKAALFVVAENETAFMTAYKRFGNSARLIGMQTEHALSSDTTLKSTMTEILEAYNKLQQTQVASPQELEFFYRTARRFEQLDEVLRVTQILTRKLDKSWFDELLINLGPVCLALPENQRWLLKNAAVLESSSERLRTIEGLSLNDLLKGSGDDIVPRAVVLGYRMYLARKENRLERELDEIVASASVFSPTLVNIVKSEYTNILNLFSEYDLRKVS